ncbi:MAG TPA: HAMP domain-containing sensor histidine kinase [Bacteroidales bacterium]|nr:HAMP domain-containing sensor histidine kinase [Bacteroidales bacterium]
MKFLDKINRNYLSIFAVSLTILSLVGYFFFKYSIWQDAKENLHQRATILKSFLIKHQEEIELEPILSIRKINKIPKITGYKRVDLILKGDDEAEPFLEYSTTQSVADHLYLITVRSSVDETEDLLLGILFFFISIIAITFLAGYLISIRMNKTLWSVFERNLKEIENYNLSKSNVLKLTSTNINEFDRLNSIIFKFVERIQKDYGNLKEITENASHEMQTPVAIAILHLEEILQHNVSEEVYGKVNTTIHALKRLSQLNQSLILLSKIENNQFKDVTLVSMGALIQKKADELLPLMEAKNISITIDIEQELELNLNIVLADILINNLFSNAIKHNFNDGFIHIYVFKDHLQICNSGNDNNIEPEKVFERFVKSNSNSYGLGLAIVKKICEMYGLEISYEKNNNHCFLIKRNL